MKETTFKDVFLSHAGADKEKYVRPFACELDRRGISYWVDEAEIAWGEKISLKINEGLKHSDFVIVFLSDAFVGRNWTEAELSSALSRENSEGRTVVLPIIIGEPSQLLEQYPLLRDKYYLNWELGVDAIADELQKLNQRQWSKAELEQYIMDNVDFERFPKKKVWGPAYRLLARQVKFDEGAYFFWNEEQKIVEKYWIDAVQSHGSEPLTGDDIQFIRSVVIKEM